MSSIPSNHEEFFKEFHGLYTEEPKVNPYVDLFTALLEELANGLLNGTEVNPMSGFDHIDEACQDVAAWIGGRLP